MNSVTDNCQSNDIIYKKELYLDDNDVEDMRQLPFAINLITRNSEMQSIRRREVEFLEEMRHEIEKIEGDGVEDKN